jgi:hypothetical protein
VECPNASEECKYSGTSEGCHLDTHHIYARSEARSGLKKRFSALACHQVEICRSAHENLEAELGWPDFPPINEMHQRIDDESQRI